MEKREEFGVFILEKLAEYAKTDRVALINREEQLTFTQMDAYSDAIAACLLARFGAEDRTPVVIYGHKQTEMLPCMYGALKAGRAYVPVDITVPADRVRDILDTVKPKLFIDLADICAGGEIPAELYGQRVDVDTVRQIFAEYIRGQRSINSKGAVLPPLPRLRSPVFRLPSVLCLLSAV